MFPQVIELTHNHGTEHQPNFNYHNGNDEDKTKNMFRGFGHVGFMTDNLEAATSYLHQENVPFRKRQEEGNMMNSVSILDPDNYSIEIIQRNRFKLLEPTQPEYHQPEKVIRQRGLKDRNTSYDFTDPDYQKLRPFLLKDKNASYVFTDQLQP